MQAEVKRATEATAGTVAVSGKIGQDLKCTPQAPFIAERVKLFEKLYEKYLQEIKGMSI